MGSTPSSPELRSTSSSEPATSSPSGDAPTEMAMREHHDTSKNEIRAQDLPSIENGVSTKDLESQTEGPNDYNQDNNADKRNSLEPAQDILEDEVLNYAHSAPPGVAGMAFTSNEHNANLVNELSTCRPTEPTNYTKNVTWSGDVPNTNGHRSTLDPSIPAADLAAGTAAASGPVPIRISRAHSVMASVQKRLHSAGQIGPDIERLTPAPTSHSIGVDDWVNSGLNGGSGKSSGSSKSASAFKPLGRNVSKIEMTLERNIRQNRERTCWCLCNRAGQFRLRDAIMFPFAALMVCGAVVIVLVQNSYTGQIQDMYVDSCNTSTETLIVDSIRFELNTSQVMLASSLQQTIQLVQLGVVSDSFSVIISTLTVLEALVTATTNQTLVDELTATMMFQNLNSTFVPLVSGASVIYIDDFLSTNGTADNYTLFSYMFDRDVEPNTALKLIGDGNDTLTLWPVNRTNGQPMGDGESFSADSFSLDGLYYQLSLVLDKGLGSRSYAAYTNLGYWLNSTAIPENLRYGFLLTWPINFCGTYVCWEGVIQTNMLVSDISRICVENLIDIQNNSNVTNKGCPLCAEYFYVTQPIPVDPLVADFTQYPYSQSGLLVGGAVNGEALNITYPDYALNYTGNPIIQNYTRKIESMNLPWNASQSFTFDITTGAECSAAVDLKLSEAELKVLYENCVVLSISPVVGDSNDPSFPVYKPFVWRAVVAVPATWSLVNYTEALSGFREQLADITEETNARVAILSAVSAIIEVCLILLTLGLSIIIASLLARPIRRLSKEIRRLTKLDFRTSGAIMPKEERSRIKEVASTQKEFVKMYYALETFARFVPATVVRDIVRSKRGRRLNVSERVVTTMFSDIQGFTTIAEKLERVDLMYLITRYLTAMTSIVEQYEGVVAEIQGDGLLAFWNTPDDIDEHASKALSAAIAQQQYLKYLSKQFQDEFRAKYDLGDFRVRIGIHTGSVLSGTIGSLTKYKFGSLGDAVNMASRLEGLSKLYGTQIICSEATLDLCTFREAFILRELDLVQVKGKHKSARIFEVVMQRAPIECKFKPPFVAADSDSSDDEEEEDQQSEGSDFTPDSGEEGKYGNASSSRKYRLRLPTPQRHLGQSGKMFKAFRPVEGSSSSEKSSSKDGSAMLYTKGSANELLDSSIDQLKRFHPLSNDARFKMDTNRIETYETALHAFQSGHFRRAEELLLGICDLESDLDVAETLLLERSREAVAQFRADDIDAELLGWTGVNTLASKSF